MIEPLIAPLRAVWGGLIGRLLWRWGDAMESGGEEPPPPLAPCAGPAESAARGAERS